jgi:hypothetical protein
MKTKLLLILLAPLFTFAQLQIGTDINGEHIGDRSGSSVSINVDGSIVAIGAPYNDDAAMDAGHVRVYQNTGGSWAQIGSDIDGEASGNYNGESVSLNAEGNILAIGAPFNDANGTNSGHVRVFEFISGDWTQIGSDIDGDASDDHSGYSSSLNADGNIIAIGSYYNDGNGTNSGHVRVFEYIDEDWTQIGADIDGEAAGDEFGSSVSISDNGSIVAVSAPGNDDNGTDSGQVKVYENMGGTWTHIGDDIDGEAAGDIMGYYNGTVSLSADGGIVAIGAHLNDGNGDNSGHVRVYQYIMGSWTQMGSDIDGEKEGDQSGWSVKLSSDGSLVAVGAVGNDGNGNYSGHVRVYEYIGGDWTQFRTDIDGEAESDQFGRSVSMSDTKIVVVGAPFNDGNGANSGHVRVFDLNFAGIDDNSQIEFSIYPIPTSGILNIQSEIPVSQIEIYNLLGQLVKSFEDTNIIDISSVEQGVYFVKVMDENGNVGTQKVVKK